MKPASQQADRCPYRRPFPPGFNDCPAFQATSFAAADSHNKPLGTWNTCRHLTSGTDREQPGRFYPRCALGGREDRLRWLAEVTPVTVVRALRLASYK